MKTHSIDLTSSGEKTLDLAPRGLSIRGKVFEGDLCDFYDATHTMPPEAASAGNPRSWYDRLLDDEDIKTHVVVKVPKKVTDIDLVENEIKVLQAMYPATAKDEKMYRYLPRPMEVLRLDLGRTVSRPALVLPFMDGYVSMADVIKAYPDGIDFRDMVWMFKRLLVAIGFAHHLGYVHGAVIPTHVLVHPIGHGAKLIDWSYAVPLNQRVRAMSAAYEESYAPEILDRKDVTGAADVYMAAKCATALLGKQDAPKPVLDFLGECMDPLPNMRRANAWDLHEAFDQILLDVVGKPKYRKFEMPGAAV